MKNTKAIVPWKMPAVPDQKKIQAHTAPLLKRVADYQILSDDHYTASWVFVLAHDEVIKRIEEMFDPFVSGLHKLHKMALAMRNQFLEPVVDSKNILLGKRKVFRERMEKIKAAADREAAKILQKQQQRELEQLAKAADKAGDQEQALAIREQKAALPLPFMAPAPAVEKQEGSVIRERWTFTITDDNLVPREYCTPDLSKIRSVVNALGDQANIPGVVVTIEKKEHSRSVAS